MPRSAAAGNSGSGGVPVFGEQTLVYFTTDEVPAAKLSALAAEIG
jgi:hypothetical protein